MSVEVVREFRGIHKFLSNFVRARVVLDGEEYPTVEHAYQAAKTVDTASRRRIRNAATPGDAKRAGRRVSLRPGWDAMRVNVMRELLCQKFAVGSPWARALLSTGDADLREGNRWGDRFWGVDLDTGEGENQLGRLLIERRVELMGGPK